METARVRRGRFKKILTSFLKFMLPLFGWMLAVAGATAAFLLLDEKAANGNYLSTVQILIADLKAAGELSASGPGRARISVLPFESFDPRNERKSALGSFVAYDVEAQLVRLTGAKYIDRANMEAIDNEKKLTLSGNVDPKTAIRIGKIEGVHYLLAGRVSVAGGYVLLSMSLIDPSTGEIVWSGTGRAIAPTYLQELAATDPVRPHMVGTPSLNPQDSQKGARFLAVNDFAAQFFIENWAWFWTVLLVPLFALAVKKIKGRITQTEAAPVATGDAPNNIGPQPTELRKKTAGQ